MIPIGILATTFLITVKIAAAIKHWLWLRARKRGALAGLIEAVELDCLCSLHLGYSLFLQQVFLRSDSLPH